MEKIEIKNTNSIFESIKHIHNVYERMKYGFPVSKEEFINSDLYIQEINESLTRVKH